MYEAVMLRQRKSLRCGFYIKKFDTLEELANYMMAVNNVGRCYRVRGLTRKEQRILTNKCWSILQKSNDGIHNEIVQSINIEQHLEDDE